jgi:hypothetical protein
MTQPDVNAAHGARRTLLLVVVLFLTPVVLATWLYVSGWRPQGRSLQHGELVQPARPLPDARLKQLDGQPYRFSALRGKWAFVYFGRLPCDAACEAGLYKMQQVWLAQGREARRVERVLIVTGGAAGMGAAAQRHQGLLVLTAPEAALGALAREFVSSQGTAHAAPGRIYLVDPIGNLVMSYAPDADPSGMRKDLARLLRLSQVG